MKRVLFAVCLAVPAFAQSTPQQPTINETVVVTASSLPETVQTTSNCPLRLVATSGCWISIRSTGRAK